MKIHTHAFKHKNFTGTYLRSPLIARADTNPFPTLDFPLLYKLETIALESLLQTSVCFSKFMIYFSLNTVDVIYCLFHRGNET